MAEVKSRRERGGGAGGRVGGGAGGDRNPRTVNFMTLSHPPPSPTCLLAVTPPSPISAPSQPSPFLAAV